MKILILSLIGLVFANNLFAQEQWLHFTNDNEVTAMAVEDDTLWTGTTGGLLKWNLVDSTYEKITVADGLVSNYINCISIDENANKWFGTIDGISKFDGSNWTTFTTMNSGLAYSNVNDIAFANGETWITTTNGVSKFDGTNWVTFNTTNSGLSHNFVFPILIDDNGNKWFGTYAGLDKYDGTNWTNYNSSNSGLIDGATCLEKDDFGNIWIGNSGVNVFDGANWTSYTYLNSGLVTIGVRNIAIDSEGNFWFGTFGGLSKFNGTVWETFNVSNSGLLSNEVNSLISDSQGNIFTGHGINQINADGGISRFDGINWKNFETPKTLTDNSVYGIKIDSNNNKWFGNHYGVNKLYGTNWEKIDGYASAYSSVLDLNNNVWFGGNQSIAKCDGTNWSYFDATNSGFPPQYSIIEAIGVDGSNNIWFCDGIDSQGIQRFDGVTNWDSFDTSNSGLISDDIYSIKQDIDGSVWFGGYNGVTNFDGTNWLTHNFPFTFSGSVLSIGIEQNIKWFGSSYNGVASFDGNTWTYYDSTNSGLLSNKVLVIEIDNLGNKWFGTDNGLCKFDGTNWTVFNKANGDLISDYIYTLASDDFGNLWIGYEGLTIFNENGVVLDVEEIKPDFSPRDFKLSQNYPNPFNPTTTIEYSIPENSFVTLEIFNVLGQKVKTLVSETKIAGNHSVKWNGTNESRNLVSSGVYFYNLKTNNFTQTRKMLLIR